MARIRGVRVLSGCMEHSSLHEGGAGTVRVHGTLLSASGGGRQLLSSGGGRGLGECINSLHQGCMDSLHQLPGAHRLTSKVRSLMGAVKASSVLPSGCLASRARNAAEGASQGPDSPSSSCSGPAAEGRAASRHSLAWTAPTLTCSPWPGASPARRRASSWEKGSEGFRGQGLEGGGVRGERGPGVRGWGDGGPRQHPQGT